MGQIDWGAWSLLPIVATLVLAFVTRSALLAMLTGTFVGTLMLGGAPGRGLDLLFRDALGDGDFIWICEIVVLIGVLFTLFKRAGVLAAFAGKFARMTGSRRKVEMMTWGLGFAIVDDYLSPLLTGAVMRPMSDRSLVPREKLAFILDATTASVCILVPFTAWGAYVSSLIASHAAVGSAEEGLTVFIAAIPYNFYPMLMILFTLLIAARLVPDFGPMRKAEGRVAATGALLRPGAKPLVTDEELDLGAASGAKKPSLIAELLVPVSLLVFVGAWTLIGTGAVRIVEAFLLADTYLLLLLALRGRFASVADAADVIVDGARSVIPALLIVAFAYALNAVTVELGAPAFIVEQFGAAISANTLVTLTFLITATISFATGTSWGAYAVMMPVALPVAFDFTGGEIGPLVYQTVAAVAGGGIFGDHASPVSDTTVLSSVGAGSDHIDHVVTQLPYALLIAFFTAVIYAWL